MKNTCYVVMPYGGDDPDLKKKSHFIYKNIIRPAAMKAGFQEEDIFREDHSGEAGNIIRNIVNHVSSSRIVIVDMTGCNANVYYELGLSHAFHKNSTVLICEKGADVRFDLSGAKRVEYAVNIYDFDDSVDAICEEIKARLAGDGKSDNSVHELLPELPAHLLDMLEMDENDLQAQLTKMTQDRDNLRAQLRNAGIREGNTHEQRSIRDILTGTKKRMQYSGTSLITKLREYAEQDDLDGFLEHLTTALELRTPTLSNINSILEICSNMNNDALVEDVLCASRMLYPDDPELMTRLAKILARRPGTRQDAMAMVNEAIGLKFDENGNYAIKDRSKLSSHNDLARFLDTYLAMENYDGLVAAATFLKDHVPDREKAMLDRNIFLSLTRKGDMEGAAQILGVIEKMDTAFSNYMISSYYNRLGDYVKEYEYLESAFLRDPEDMDYPRMLAAHILNEDLVRTPEGIRTVASSESRKAAAALLYYIIENRPFASEDVQKVIELMQRSRNRLEDYLAQAIPFLKKAAGELPYEITNRYPLDYVLDQLS